MSNLTVQSSMSGQTVNLNFNSKEQLQLARQLAFTISQGVAAGTLEPAASSNGTPPTLPAGGSGVFFQETKGLTFLPTGYNAVVNTAPNASIFGSGGNRESVLSGNGGLTFVATGGSGTVAAGGGKNEIIIMPNDKGSWLIGTGGLNDSILALGSGNDSIRPGAGHNTVLLGSGNDMLTLSGQDIIVATNGHDTVDATAAKSTLLNAESANLTFVGGAGAATILGGTGSDTVFGGSGHLVVHGGTAGNNLLLAGAGAATLFGGGNGDQLYAEGSRAQTLIAGAGNETLSAALSFGHVSLQGGLGQDQIIAGSGQDTLTAGMGNATMHGGFGKDTFAFIDGSAGGKDLILNFMPGDKIDLSGYGKHAVTDALASQTATSGGVTITLSDRTKITFADVTSLNKTNFT